MKMISSQVEDKQGRKKGRSWQRYFENKAGVFGLIIFSLVLLVTFFGPLLYPINPFEMAGKRFLPPGGAFPLGTDYLGRDVLAGIVHGTKTSFFVGIMAALVMMTIGIFLGPWQAIMEGLSMMPSCG